MAHEAHPDPFSRQMAAREIYIERQVRGSFAQVRAIDALTGLEVAVTTPSNAAQFDQNRLVLRKLGQCLVAQGHMVLDNWKDNGASSSEKGEEVSKNTTTSLPRRGIYT